MCAATIARTTAKPNPVLPLTRARFVRPLVRRSKIRSKRTGAIRSPSFGRLQRRRAGWTSTAISIVELGRESRIAFNSSSVTAFCTRIRSAGAAAVPCRPHALVLRFQREIFRPPKCLGPQVHPLPLQNARRSRPRAAVACPAGWPLRTTAGAALVVRAVRREALPWIDRLRPLHHPAQAPGLPSPAADLSWCCRQIRPIRGTNQASG